jgi:cytochrome c-type biogenesis protein CcmH/NrfG
VLRALPDVVPPNREGQLAVLRDVRRLLKAFPGATHSWWASYRLLEALGDMAGAWQSLARARRLDPDNRRYKAVSLLLATAALPAAEAELHIEQSARPLEEAGPDVCLMYALAQLRLAPRSRAKERWRRSLEASQAACPRPRPKV